MSRGFRERSPEGRGWLEHPCPSISRSAHGASAYQLGRICVISALEMAELPVGDGVGLQWHVSISRMGKRPSADDIRIALKAFRMTGSEEDNHHPGNARHFWLPVDPEHRVDCQCKASETTVVDPDGYKWTNPRDGAACRGCEFEAVGGPCPIHGGAQ